MFLQKEFDWVPYGGKHYESIYTRFFQSYILPTKFDIDKRKLHFSALIRSRQITREEALKKISEEEICPLNQVEKDKEYVIKKLGLTHSTFGEIMSKEIKTFKDYDTYYSAIKLLRLPIKFAVKLNVLSMRFEKFTEK